MLPAEPWRDLDPRFPWIKQIYTSQFSGCSSAGPCHGVLLDTRTGEQVRVNGPSELSQYLAAHSSAPGYGGLGDLFRGITKLFGAKPCAPCAKRQAALNAVAPRVFRRR